MLRRVLPFVIVMVFSSCKYGEEAEQYALWKQEIGYIKTCLHDKYCKVKTKYGEYCYSREMSHNFPCEVLFGPTESESAIKEKMKYLMDMFGSKEDELNDQKGEEGGSSE